MSARSFILVVLALTVLVSGRPLVATQTGVFEVRSRDGTRIVYECSGGGPELLVVHGGTGDRTRWSPFITHLKDHFTVCAMDRRAHGQSGDGSSYSLIREAEDVAAVVNSRGRPVVVLGHSFGAVAAYEAAFLTPSIGKLILYEPPFQVPAHAASLARMDRLIRAGNPDAATVIFMREVVGMSPDEIASMRQRASWNGLVSSIEGSIRQHRALAAYKWDSARAKTLRLPTLLLVGSLTKSSDLRRSAQIAASALPNGRLIWLEGQQHNAMDTAPATLAVAVTDFALPRS